MVFIVFYKFIEYAVTKMYFVSIIILKILIISFNFKLSLNERINCKCYVIIHHTVLI